jgi:hypothetical protein
LAAGQLTPQATQALQETIDQVCASIVHLENKNKRIDDSEIRDDYPKDPAELADLREQLEHLVKVLKLDNPDFAEPLLASLQGKLPNDDFKRIQSQLADFDFRAAIISTQALLKKLHSC